MIGWLWMALLAGEPSPVGQHSSRTPEPLQIDILLKQPEQDCKAQSADEIVVCADKTDDEVHRLRPIANANIYGKDESRADFGVAENVRMAAEVDSADMGRGVTSKRIMVRMKVKF